jgi:hypothetical protein
MDPVLTVDLNMLKLIEDIRKMRQIAPFHHKAYSELSVQHSREANLR